MEQPALHKCNILHKSSERFCASPKNGHTALEGRGQLLVMEIFDKPLHLCALRRSQGEFYRTYLTLY